MIQVKNSAKSAEIYISGDIIDDADGEEVKAWYGDDASGYKWPDRVKNELDAIDDDAPLTVYINSDGGSVPAGIAIANMIARHKGETTAIVDGWCCSIATQVFFAADHRIIPENAYLMIHKPSTIAIGDADDLHQAAHALDVIQKGLETTYNAHALDGVSPDEIHDMVESTTWLTGEDAAKFFDVEVKEATQAAACVGGALHMLGDIPSGIRLADTSNKKAHDVPKVDKAEDVEDKDSFKKRVAVAIALAKA